MSAAAFVLAGLALAAVLAFACSENDSVAGVSISAPFEAFTAELAGNVLASVGAAAGTSVVAAGAEESDDAFWRTETFPLNAGIDIRSAVTIKIMAEAIVAFDNTEAVPRGARAALETLLVNNAPASVFPGCNSTEMIKMTHERKNNPYRI